MKFKPGQEVVCVGSGNWFREFKVFFGFLWRKESMIGPKNGELVTVEDYSHPGFVLLKEYKPIVEGERAGYTETAFEPVVPSETIEELMNELQLSL